MKKNYLIKSKLLFKIYLIYFGFKYRFFSRKKSYSQFGEDLVINNFFGQHIGKYVDVGCYHPIKYSNTTLLHKKGWQGINIDLNEPSIDLFNSCRKNDLNIHACLSDRRERVTVFLDSNFSALNSMNSKNSKIFKFINIKKIKVETQIFSDLVKENFDFLNIDCEGNDHKILKSIDLTKYTPSLINIEVSDENKEVIYNYLTSNNYKLLKIKSLSHIFKKNE
jgi:FkbM family methyltransferase